jgi:hypothetical protein
MARLALVGAVAALMFLAGCVEEGSSARVAKKSALAKEALSVAEGLLPTLEPLWINPQYYPHPLYNYPTLTNPPNVISNPWLEPIPAKALPANIQGLTPVATVEGTARSSGMSVIGSLAILPSSPTRIVDISDPTHPKILGEFNVSARGSDVIVYPDQRIVAVLATGGLAIVLADISDPTAPYEVSRIQTRGTHKVDVVPGTPIIYNSENGEIFDASDPFNPANVTAKMPATCHRTYFYNDPAREMYRAYCAGYAYTHIWDTADPSNPTVIKSIPMWHARDDLQPTSVTPVTFSHFSIPNDDATVLIVGDEMGGGVAPACTAHVGTPVRDASIPTGALWFYDISDEKNPRFLSWISPRASMIDNPTSTPPSCTAHHGRIVPDPTRDLLAMGFYSAGVVLVDFTDPASPKIIDQEASGMKVWEAVYYNGYVFTGDMGRGLDTLGFN